MLGEPTPAETDPCGDVCYCERCARKDTGGDGWADVWQRHHFAWEYKSPVAASRRVFTCGRPKDAGHWHQEQFRTFVTLEHGTRARRVEFRSTDDGHPHMPAVVSGTWVEPPMRGTQ